MNQSLICLQYATLSMTSHGYSIQHHSAKSVEAFRLFSCLNYGVYDTITSNAVSRRFHIKSS